MLIGTYVSALRCVVQWVTKCWLWQPCLGAGRIGQSKGNLPQN